MQRRDFISRATLALGALPVLGSLPAAARTEPPTPFDPADWSAVRNQFALSHSRIHMASFLLASHPKRVAAAIERHRRAFDEDPALHWEENFITAEPRVQEAAGEYLQTDPAQIALTDSTTMGLGLIYGALQLRPEQEILTTTHDHYATSKSLRLRAERTGAGIREVALYDDAAAASVDHVVSRMRDAITAQTRVLAVTWVHSSTGVKLPVGEMSRALTQINAEREPSDRVLFCVDGVHGLGVDDVTIEDLGCDFLIAGTHKWLFGPRGTGIIWGSPEGWEAVAPIIPSFGPSVAVWLGLLPADTPRITPGTYHSPGGFHSFEHRWALDEAFRFHLAIGKARIQQRIHSLNTMAKQALSDMAHVRLHTPMSPELSAGIICFEVDGHEPGQVVSFLKQRGIVASTSPYPVSYARVAPALINNEDEVEQTMAAIRDMKA